MLCVDVVAECDRYVGERWERGVCTGKEGGPGGVRGVEGGGVVSPPPSTHAWVESTAWMTRWGWPSCLCTCMCVWLALYLWDRDQAL